MKKETKKRGPGRPPMNPKLRRVSFNSKLDPRSLKWLRARAKLEGLSIGRLIDKMCARQGA